MLIYACSIHTFSLGLLKKEKKCVSIFCGSCLTPKGLTVPINQIGQYNVCFLSRMPVTEGMVMEASFGPTKVSQLAEVVRGLSPPGGLKA